MIARHASQSADYVWNTIGVLLQNAVSPLLLIAVTRVHHEHDAGMFAYAFAVALVGSVVSLWGGRTYQVSDARGEFSEQTYLASRFVLAGLVGLGSVVFCLVNAYDIEKSAVILALVGFKLVESIADPLYGMLQIRGALYRSGVSLTLKAIGGVAGFVAVDILTRNLLMATLALVAINVLITLLYDVRWVRRVAPHLSVRGALTQQLPHVRRLLSATLPVVVVSVLTILTLVIPRYAVDRFHHEQNIYFGIIVMPLTAMLLVVLFVLQPRYMHLVELYARGDVAKFDAAVRRVLFVVLLASIGIFGVTALIGVELLQAIFGIELSQYVTSLAILTGAGVLNALVATYVAVVTILRKFRAQIVVLAATNSCVVIGSFLAIPSGGVAAAALVVLGASVSQSISLAVAYRQAIARGEYAANT